MSDLRFKLPGSADHFIETDDINLLDADSAHIHQSEGFWNTVNHGIGVPAANIVQSQDIPALFGSYVLKMTCTASNPRLRRRRVPGRYGRPARA